MVTAAHAVAAAFGSTLGPAGATLGELLTADGTVVIGVEPIEGAAGMFGAHPRALGLRLLAGEAAIIVRVELLEMAIDPLDHLLAGHVGVRIAHRMLGRLGYGDSGGRGRGGGDQECSEVHGGNSQGGWIDHGFLAGACRSNLSAGC
jgi:hypothetical protein